MNHIFQSREAWVKNIETSPDPVCHGIRKLITSQVKVGPVDPATGMNDINFIISTAAVDRERDVIFQDGWDLEPYLKNPVVLWAHDYWSPPVGRAESVEVKDSHLIAVDRFTPEDVNPFGNMIYRMIRGGFLNATSVGFQPTEWTYNEEHSGYDFLKNELLEHSVVPVPANPEALVQASASGIDLRPMRSWVERFLDSDPSVQQFSLIPRELAEETWKELGNVGKPPMVTVTSGYCHVNDTGAGDTGWTGTTTVGTGIGDAGDISIWPGTGDTYWLRGYDLDWWHREVNTVISNEQEAEMEEAIKELIEEIRNLRGDLGDVKALLDKAPDDTDPAPPEPEPEMSADEVRSLVRETVQEVITATTGALPE